MKIWKPVVEYIGFSFYYGIKKGETFFSWEKFPLTPSKTRLAAKYAGLCPCTPQAFEKA